MKGDLKLSFFAPGEVIEKEEKEKGGSREKGKGGRTERNILVYG